MCDRKPTVKDWWIEQAKNEPRGIVAAGKGFCAYQEQPARSLVDGSVVGVTLKAGRDSSADWFRRKQIAHLSGAVADWIEDLGLSRNDAAAVTGLPAERLAALVANDPAGVTAGEAGQAYHALVTYALEHW
jgi:hypothetical protein